MKFHSKFPKLPFIGFLLAGAGLAVLILVASWTMKSRMSTIWRIPEWLATVADRDPDLRTAIPFFPLAFLLTHTFFLHGILRPWLPTIVSCGVIALLAEIGQIVLPDRTLDWRDLGWGAIGIFVGNRCALLFRPWVSGKKRTILLRMDLLTIQNLTPKMQHQTK